MGIDHWHWKPESSLDAFFNENHVTGDQNTYPKVIHASIFKALVAVEAGF
jgi:hypothetical protein